MFCDSRPDDLLPVAILAGGIATRLRPITEKIPKALVNIAGEPFIYHQLRLLRKNGVRRVVICAGYKGEMIQEAVGNGESFDLTVDYSFDGPKLLGTAGALARARDKLGTAFFILYGDSYLTCDYNAVQCAFITQNKSALMTVYENKGLYDSSNIVFRDDRIVAYDKQTQTPDMRWIDYGLGVMKGIVLDRIPPDEVVDLASLYGELLREDDLGGFEVAERFYEIGSFSGLEELDVLLSSS